ncbi:unnamed protein product [Cunninghamella blakesleeana]
MTNSNNLRFSETPPLEPSIGFFPKFGKFVTVDTCYYYVSFLECFWTQFDTMTPIEQQHYLARAEWRYEKYLLNYHKLCSRPPPIDIAFLWHIHMLSPFHYYEDINLRFKLPDLFNEHFPLCGMRIVGDIPFPIPPENWNEIFGDEPFYLTKNNMYEGSYKRKCYNCQQIIELSWPTYVSYRFGKNTALFIHDGCGPEEGINFFDITRMKLEADLFKPIPSVAGTLLTSDGNLKDRPNRIIPFVKQISVIIPKNELDYAYEKQLQELLKFHGEKYEYDVNELLYAIRTCYQGNPSPFSIDLIHGVARHRRFYEDIMKMNWNGYKGFANGIRGYHDFLVLMNVNPHLRALPSVEIDVAFHTHMLHCSEYRDTLLHYMNRVINHDDDVTESLVDHYSKDWKDAWIKLPFSYIVTALTKKNYRLNEATLKLSVDSFKSYYHVGRVHVFTEKTTEKVKASHLLNKEMYKRYLDREIGISVSVHNYGTDRRIYERGNEVSLKDLQTFVGEGMQFHCYGYTGCVNLVTGGNSALIYKESSSNDEDDEENYSSGNRRRSSSGNSGNSSDVIKLIFNPLESKKLFKKKTVQVRSAFSNRNGFKNIRSYQHQDPTLPMYTFDDLPSYNELNQIIDQVNRVYMRFCPDTFGYDHVDRIYVRYRPNSITHDLLFSSYSQSS